MPPYRNRAISECISANAMPQKLMNYCCLCEAIIESQNTTLTNRIQQESFRKFKLSDECGSALNHTFLSISNIPRSWGVQVNHVCFQGHWLQCSFVALKWSKSVFWQIQLSHPCPTNSSNVSLPSWSRSRAANRLAIPSLKVEKSMHFEMELYEAKFNFELIEIKNKLANCSSWLD